MSDQANQVASAAEVLKTSLSCAATRPQVVDISPDDDTEINEITRTLARDIGIDVLTRVDD